MRWTRADDKYTEKTLKKYGKKVMNEFWSLNNFYIIKLSMPQLFINGRYVSYLLKYDNDILKIAIWHVYLSVYSLYSAYILYM